LAQQATEVLIAAYISLLSVDDIQLTEDVQLVVGHNSYAIFLRS